MAPRKKCPHSDLTFQVSSHADEAGFQREDWRRRHAATVPSGRAPPKNRGTSEPSDSSPPQGQDDSSLDSLFPAPLVLPGDDLALDPTCPPQSLASWLRGKHRNKFTPARKTLYVASVPTFSQDAAMMEDWTRPKLEGVKGANKARASAPDHLAPPNPDDIREYLEAFYHGIPVKMFNETLEFTTWESGQKNRAKKDTASSFIGLRCGSSCTRIRARPCPDGTYAKQLNLDDILDAAITALPEDAYAILFLVGHDLYEDDDDDFGCGRAYGGSRVAVVSSARYNPALLLSSGADGIDLDHTWPASHCMSYVARLCGSATAPRGKKRRRDEQEAKPAASPLHYALHASRCSSGDAAAEGLNTSSSLGGLWLCLLARTASHELGHCLGIGHCVYYACVMQGTAGMAEDCRQPPYLCPVCLKKLTNAAREATTSSSSSSSSDSFEEIGYVIGNYQALARFCDKWRQVGMFAGYKAWLDNMAGQLRGGSFTL
ncbi:hypothetical protein KVR01_001262 [Diaporthe batatas]|uniref:uncharacterized protein n=1 Tax=Diaporthe batatas TaxID=748121 RepID=UPI001D036A5F|nr:uncharacterized protein KVR01_001262 [Diaporthe batatas]KAG8168513.1 hypothetical protein KVR01_001262 [Diaporthe batatas]